MDHLGALDIPAEYSAASMVQAVPKEVLAVLPTDPYEQLQLANRISCRAFTQKMASLESEVGHLRRVLADKDSHIRTLETRLTTCQLELQEAAEKARASVEAQRKLAGEKGALVNTVRKLNRDIAKLEGFKRSLLTTLQANEETADELGAELGAVDLAGEALVQEALHQELQQYASSKNRTPAGAAPLDIGRGAAHSPSAGAFGPATGGRTPLRCHDGSGGPFDGSGGASPAAGYDLPARRPAHQDHPRSYEPAGQPMSQPVSEHVSQHAKSGYGSPLDLPRADYSNASELSTGLEASDPFGGENHSAEPRRPNGYGGAADGRSPAPPAGGYGPPADGYGPPANGYSPAADAYGTGGREPSAARDAPPPPAARVPEHREAAHMPRAYGNGLAPPPPNVQGGRALVSDAPPPGRDGGARDGHAGAARPGSGEQLDGREFFRRARARLATEPFAAFLAAIKELNSGRRSRADTLRLARDVFCPRDADLYSAFEGLLNRHLPAS